MLLHRSSLLSGSIALHNRATWRASASTGVLCQARGSAKSSDCNPLRTRRSIKRAQASCCQDVAQQRDDALTGGSRAVVAAGTIAAAASFGLPDPPTHMYKLEKKPHISETYGEILLPRDCKLWIVQLAESLGYVNPLAALLQSALLTVKVNGEHFDEVQILKTHKLSAENIDIKTRRRFKVPLQMRRRLCELGAATKYLLRPGLPVQKNGNWYFTWELHLLTSNKAAELIS